MMSKLLIVSTGRTGTRTLASVMNRPLDNVMAVHEQPVFRKQYYDALKVYLKDGDESKWYRDSLFTQYRNILDIPIYIDNYIISNSFLTLFADSFLDYYSTPEDMGYVLFVVRNGIDIVRTGMSRPDHPDDHFEYYNKDLFSAKCKMWSVMNQFVEDLRENDNYADRIKFIKYEDLFDREQYNDKRFDLIAWLEANGFWDSSNSFYDSIVSTRLNSTNEYAIGDYESWDDEMKQTFTHYNYPLMVKYGYWEE